MSGIDFGNDFNVDQYEDMAEFTILPAYWYLVTLTKDEKKESKNNPGSAYMNIELTVISDNFKGRKIFNMLNLWYKNHDSKKQSDILGYARRELATMCRAMGKNGAIANSSDLYNIPFGIKIKHRKDQQSGEMREQIAAYCTEKEFSGKVSGSVTTSTTTQAANTQAPWSS